MAGFYVYVHRRADTRMPFYVGKGSDRRAWVIQHRSRYWRNVVAKAGGFDVEIVAVDLPEELALLAEVEMISKMRSIGHGLTNLTDGGEGMSGFRFASDTVERRAAKQRGQKRPIVSKKLKGRSKSAEHREALRMARTGMKASPQTRELMSKTRAAMPISVVKCLHCGVTMQRMNAARWHGENCKGKS